MALVLTEEQSMLRDSARGLVADRAPIAHLRKLRDGRDADAMDPGDWVSSAGCRLDVLSGTEYFAKLAQIGNADMGAVDDAGRPMVGNVMRIGRHACQPGKW